MKSCFFLLLALAGSLLFSVHPLGAQGNAQIEKPAKRYLVTVHEHVSAEEFARQRGRKPKTQRRDSPSGFAGNLQSNEALVMEGFKLMVLDLDESELRALKRNKQVLLVEEDGPITLGDGGDTFPLPEQEIGEGMHRMGIPQFPLARINGIDQPHQVEVAVMDTGIDNHEDLNVVRTFSAVSLDGGDEIGHGTRIAGILAAKDNGIGVVGVAPGVAIWNIKVISATRNSWMDFMRGLYHVYENADRVSVLNISLGNESDNAPISTIRFQIRQVVRAGVVVVAAAGNKHHDLAGPDAVYGTGDDALTASLPEVMAVSGMNPYTDQLWIHAPGSLGTNFSQVPQPLPSNPDPTVVYPVSTGGAIDVAAPAVDILTTAAGVDADGIGRNYRYGNGTSAAAPHVAGLVALYIAANGRAYDEKGVYKIRQAIIDQSQALQPQSAWAAEDTLDPDDQPEALAVPSAAWVPMPALTQTLNSPADLTLTASIGPPDATVPEDDTAPPPPPRSIPGYLYQFQKSLDLVDWTILDAFPGNGEALQTTDTDLTANRGFYRLNIVAEP